MRDIVFWVDRQLVLSIHERQLAEHGGSAGVRDETLLESALARPRQLLAYGNPPPDLAALAASLAYGLARNHPFVDGNKRAAHVCYRVFLELNSVRLEAPLEEMYARILALAEGLLSEAGFADWLRTRLQMDAPPYAVHEPAPPYRARASTVEKIRPGTQGASRSRTQALPSRR